MMVQARPFAADILRQIPMAASDAVQPADQIDGLPHRKGARKRSEISGLILCHPPRKNNAGKILPHRDLNKRIRLIILKQRIIPGSVLLDQIALQHQRLQFRVRDNVLEPPDMCHHLFDLGTFIAGGLKILSDPVSQADRLAYIYDRILLVVHDVYARGCRQLFQFFGNVKNALVIHLDYSIR